MFTNLLDKLSLEPKAFTVVKLDNISSFTVTTDAIAALSITEREKYSSLGVTRAAIYLRRTIIRRHVLAAISRVNIADINYDLALAKPRIYSSIISDFSTSYSNDSMLVAMVSSGNCGIDIEYVRPLKYLDAVMRRFFTFTEIAEVVAAANKEAMFFKLWVNKEAAVKMLGTGMFKDASCLQVLSGKIYSFTVEDFLGGLFIIDLGNGYISTAFSDNLSSVVVHSYDCKSEKILESAFSLL